MGAKMAMNEETRRKLRELNLGEMIDALEIQTRDGSYIALSFEERVQMAVDYVYQEKSNAKVQRLIGGAKFRLPGADTASIIYEGRGLNGQTVRELATCQFMDSHASVVLEGFTGSGKTFLACAIGKQACKLGLRVRYVRVPDLLVLRDEASVQNQSIPRLLRKFCGYSLLILDEWLFEKPTADDRHFLFELMERRSDSASTVFCTQYRKGDWHSRLGGGAHADAIMDRIVHNSVWLEAGTVNMREQLAKQR
jgi:DNA replication protein DnaC